MSRKPRRSQLVVHVDEQLGQLRLGEKQELLSIDLYPHALETLGKLQEESAELVLLAGAAKVGVRDWAIDPRRPIRVFGIGPDGLGGELDLRWANQGKQQQQGAIGFVSSDRHLRGAARKRGWEPYPHLDAALWGLNGEEAAYYRVEGEVDLLGRIDQCLPCHLGRSRQAGMAIALMSPGASKQAIARGLRLARLCIDPAIEDLLLIRLDAGVGPAPQRLPKNIVFAEPGAIWVALGSEDKEDDHLLHGSHGHNLLIRPNPALLMPAPAAPSREKLSARLAQWGGSKLKIEVALDHPPFDLGLWSCPASAAEMELDVHRYSGGTDPGGGPIRSRHISHAGNGRAVDLLVADLSAMGYCPHRFAFSHGGRTLYNVVADLPGRGTIRIVPDIREKLRTILIRHPPWPPEPDPPWREAIEKLGLGDGFGGSDLSDEQLLRRIQTVFDLNHAGLWWRPRCRLAGCGAQLVMLGCHLDSTAARDSGYDPALGDAQGVDDDASGIAATLAIARQLAGRVGHFRHTIRFCFFNAEEQGLIGSRAYAAYLKSWSAPVRAVICTDMIGYNSDAEKIFEIHAGYTDPAIRDLSVPIATRIADWSTSLGQPGPSQLYRGTLESGGADRTLVDGAINRSDHASFHEQGYPAVVVSEDFFVNMAIEPGSDPNPNYHRASDTAFNAAYAADIACVIAQTVKELAQ